MPTETVPASIWIKKRDAARLIDVAPRHINRLIDQGLLSVRILPGSHPRVRRDEVVKLAEKCVRPATASK